MRITSSFWRLPSIGKLLISKMRKLSYWMAIGGLLWLTAVGPNASAATQIFGWDFETGTLANNFDSNVSAATSLSTTNPHGGIKSLYYHPFNASTSGDTVRTFSATPDIYCRWWWWIPSTIQGGAPGQHGFRIKQGSNQLDTVFQGTGGTGFGIDVLMYGESPVIDTPLHGILNFPTNQWFQFAIRANLGTPGLANGIIQIWINGSQVYSKTNVLFRRAGSSNTGWDKLAIVTNFDGAGTGTYWYMDDLEVWDGIPTGGGPPSPLNLRVQ